MLAYALNYILATALASLLQSILMYYISREPDAYQEKVSACLLHGIGIGIVIALLENLCADALSQTMNKPKTGEWFKILAWIIPAFAANSILTSWYRARQDVPTMVVFFEIYPAALRLLLFTAILAMSLSPICIGYAYIASYAVPFIILFAKKPLPLTLNLSQFSLWDISYGFQSMLAQLVNKSIRNLVIFIVGFFVSAGAVAELTLAMRFGQFLQMPKLALAQLQIPRIGAFLKEKNQDGLLKEFNTMRNISLLATIAGTGALMLIAPLIFYIFPEYEAAYPLLLILAAASIIRAGFGAIGGYLNIAGYAGYGLITNTLTLMFLGISLLYFVPLYAGKGAALSLALAAFFSMAFMAWVIFKKEHVNTFAPIPLILTILSSAALIFYAVGLE